MDKPEPKQTASFFHERLRKLPKRPILIGGIITASLLVLVLVILWPRQMSLSYGQRACLVQPMIAPGLVSRSDEYDLVPDRVVKVGEMIIAAGGVCLHPKKAPQPGKQQVFLSVVGLPFIGKQVTVNVSPPPKLSQAVLSRPVPVSRPLTIPLDATDKTFEYRLRAGDKSTPCKSQQSAIQCDVVAMGLAQGTAYEMTIERLFGGVQSSVAIKEQVTTLSATSVKATSIVGGEKVYAKPRAIELQLDKEIKSATATLVRADGDKRRVLTQLAVSGTKVVVSWSEELPREAAYTLTLDKVEAGDGSGLVEPFNLPFATSGGPKVSSMSVGTARVPMGATVVITFDQLLSEKQDISKILSLSGGATLMKREGARVFLSFAGVPKCGDVVMKIGAGLQSNYDIASSAGWQYTTRTICHTVGSIGASVQGRSITAYYFGSGPNAVIYTGSIHGDESSTRSLMMRWIDDLEAKARSIPADKTVVVVPAINPDGVASGRRTNANNVDLNRNFNTSDWRKDITTVTNAPFPGGGGASAMSEPETRAIAGLVSRLRPQLVLSYHSIGGVVAANQAGISSSRTSTYSSLSGYGNSTGATGSVFEYSVSGTADDYYGERLGVASMLVELGSHTYHQFERNQKAMWAMLR